MWTSLVWRNDDWDLICTQFIQSVAIIWRKLLYFALTFVEWGLQSLQVELQTLTPVCTTFLPPLLITALCLECSRSPTTVTVCNRGDGWGHPDTQAQTDPESERGSPSGEAADLLGSTRGALVQSSLLPPEPFPQLHRGQRGEAALLPAKVLARRPLLHRFLFWPDVPWGETEQIIVHFLWSLSTLLMACYGLRMAYAVWIKK